MPNGCVAGGCLNVPDLSRNVGLHKFPGENDLEKNRQRLWVAFVRTKCAKWSPTATSQLFSQHFNIDNFESLFITIPGTDFVSRAVLKKGAVPSIYHQKDPEPEMADLRSTRKHRSVSANMYCIYCSLLILSRFLNGLTFSQIYVIFVLNRL
jgi:hypothetical protein